MVLNRHAMKVRVDGIRARWTGSDDGLRLLVCVIGS
jgi:hypothetical protein